MSNNKNKKITTTQEESLRSMKSLHNILSSLNDLDKTDKRTLIRILKKSDDFKDIIEEEVLKMNQVDKKEHTDQGIINYVYMILADPVERTEDEVTFKEIYNMCDKNENRTYDVLYELCHQTDKLLYHSSTQTLTRRND